MESSCKCDEKLNYISEKGNYGQNHSEKHKKVVHLIVSKVNYYLDTITFFKEFSCPYISYYKYEYPGPECYISVSWRKDWKSLIVYFDNQDNCSATINGEIGKQISINSPEHLLSLLKEIL